MDPCIKQSSEKFVDLSHARFDEQRKVMSESVARGECPFCLEVFMQYHAQPILKQGVHWLLTHNRWPYKHSRPSLLLIYKTHVENLGDVITTSGSELMLLLQWAEREFKIKSGAVVMRFGDIRINGATVAHLHCHIVVPDITDPTFETLRVKVGILPTKE
ncbi:MAG: hypothetical protein AAB482_00920 [Patescibacteria group bacterium]